MSKDNQKYVKTLAKVCRKKKYLTALKSMSSTSKSMSQHTKYVKSVVGFYYIHPKALKVGQPLCDSLDVKQARSF